MTLFKTPRVVHESVWVSKISWIPNLRLLLYHLPSLPRVPRLILSCCCTVVLVLLSTTKCPKCLSLPWCHHQVHSCGTRSTSILCCGSHSTPTLFYIPSSSVNITYQTLHPKSWYPEQVSFFTNIRKPLVLVQTCFLLLFIIFIF